ncbi:MAG: hypothetical protein R3A45_13065 [Bdellovibrionota bacterium]
MKKIVLLMAVFLITAVGNDFAHAQFKRNKKVEPQIVECKPFELGIKWYKMVAEYPYQDVNGELNTKIDNDILIFNCSKDDVAISLEKYLVSYIARDGLERERFFSGNGFQVADHIQSKIILNKDGTEDTKYSSEDAKWRRSIKDRLINIFNKRSEVEHYLGLDSNN